MKDLYQPENDAEAEVLKKILAEHGIEASAVSFHDTAYNGLFQAQRGWGVIRVPDEHYEEALEIIAEWKAAAPPHLPWGEEDKRA